VTPVQSAHGTGLWDAFVSKINPSGSALVYSTYLGGSNDDYGEGIAVDSSGAAYVAGTTMSSDFPLASPMQGAFGGVLDAFVSKISGGAQPVVIIGITLDAPSVPRGATLGYTVTATNTTATTQCFDYWEKVTLPNGSTYPATGALFGPVNTCLPAGASQNAHLTHGVPVSAPLGTYTLNAFTGSFHPTIVVSEAHANFNVTAPVAPMVNPHTSWRLIENGFRR